VPQPNQASSRYTVTDPSANRAVQDLYNQTALIASQLSNITQAIISATSFADLQLKIKNLKT